MKILAAVAACSLLLAAARVYGRVGLEHRGRTSDEPRTPGGRAGLRDVIDKKIVRETVTTETGDPVDQIMSTE